MRMKEERVSDEKGRLDASDVSVPSLLRCCRKLTHEWEDGDPVDDLKEERRGRTKGRRDQREFDRNKGRLKRRTHDPLHRDERRREDDDSDEHDRHESQNDPEPFPDRRYLSEYVRTDVVFDGCGPAAERREEVSDGIVDELPGGGCSRHVDSEHVSEELEWEDGE